MKWEILKGSERGFEGVPEWAMQVVRLIVDYECIGYETNITGEQSAGDLVWWPDECDESDAHEIKGMEVNSLEGIIVVAQRRPITESVVNQQLTTEWSGEGLPPVGIECEMLWNNEWMKCAIKAYGDEQFIFKADGHREWAGHISNFSFRPIRSHEDVARAKVRSQECDKIFSILSGVERQGNRSDMAEAIYDAGYRKVE